MMTTAATRVAQAGLRAGAATMKGGSRATTIVVAATATVRMTTITIVAALLRAVAVMAVGSGTRRVIPRLASVAGRNGVDPAAAVGRMSSMTIGTVRHAVETTMMIATGHAGAAVGLATPQVIPRRLGAAGEIATRLVPSRARRLWAFWGPLNRRAPLKRNSSTRRSRSEYRRNSHHKE